MIKIIPRHPEAVWDDNTYYLPSKRQVWLNERPHPLTVLHELGHAFDPLLHSQPIKYASGLDRIKCEAAAWRWAVRHYGFPLTRADKRHIRKMFQTYLWRREEAKRLNAQQKGAV